MKADGNHIKVFILGARHVGKSAITVRYLTRRYIGEYKSNTDLSYRQSFAVEGSNIEVELVDLSNEPDDTTLPVSKALNGDGVIVVYSIVDRASFRAARDALLALRNVPNRSSTIPLLLLANKKDLTHLREVDVTEGKELAQKYRTDFSEVSAAEGESETAIYEIFHHIIHEARSAKLTQITGSSLPSLNYSHGTVGSLLNNTPYTSSSNNNNNNNNVVVLSALGPNNNNNTVERRQRKKSVFTMSRVIGSLIGRNSVSRDAVHKSSSLSTMTVAMPNVEGTLKSVFKKRSV